MGSGDAANVTVPNHVGLYINSNVRGVSLCWQDNISSEIYCVAMLLSCLSLRQAKLIKINKLCWRNIVLIANAEWDADELDLSLTFIIMAGMWQQQESPSHRSNQSTEVCWTEAHQESREQRWQQNHKKKLRLMATLIEFGSTSFIWWINMLFSHISRRNK